MNVRSDETRREMILIDAADAEVLPEYLPEKMSEACEALCAAFGLDDTFLQLSVSFVSEEEIRAYNRDYRGVDSVTDVLSFPQYESLEEVRAACTSALTKPALHTAFDHAFAADIGTSDGPPSVLRRTTSLKSETGKSCASDVAPAPVLIGDVVICLQRARQQAEDYGHSDAREIIYLFVHSMLHLLGYDHETEHEKRSMRAEEEAIMGQIGLGAPARVEETANPQCMPNAEIQRLSRAPKIRRTEQS